MADCKITNSRCLVHCIPEHSSKRSLHSPEIRAL